MGTFSGVFQVDIASNTLIRITFCNKCFTVTFPTTVFVHGCSCGTNVLLKLKLCTMKTLLFFPTGVANDCCPFLLTCFVLAYKLSFLRADSGPCVLSVKARTATAQHLGLTRSFGPVNSLLKVCMTVGFVRTGLGPVSATRQTRLGPTRFTVMESTSLSMLVTPCLAVKVIVLIVLLIVHFARVPGGNSRSRDVGFNPALGHVFSVRRCHRKIITRFFCMNTRVVY